MWKGLSELRVPLMYCSVNLVEKHTHPLQIMAYSMNLEGQWRQRPITVSGTAIVSQIWRNQELVYRPDLEREDLYDECSHLNAPLRSIVDVPFSQGTLAISSEQPEVFSPKDLEILQEMYSDRWPSW